ncbi:ficolin-1-like [Mytilus edulis]|uniref:ficolin-1-like n=1 Tax=Mytilus edulis TaxID=6550 RepID=UPI0039EEFBDF
MRSMIRNYVQEELQDVLKPSLKEDSTKDLIRNITLQEMNDILEEQGWDKLFHPVNNEGNKNIHSLTSSGKYELRTDLKDLSNTKKYSVYKSFIVGGAESKYKLTVVNDSGNAGDSMAIHNGMKFCTIDPDTDRDSGADCARPYGAWWHNHCGAS